MLLLALLLLFMMMVREHIASQALSVHMIAASTLDEVSIVIDHEFLLVLAIVEARFVEGVIRAAAAGSTTKLLRLGNLDVLINHLGQSDLMTDNN